MKQLPIICLLLLGFHLNAQDFKKTQIITSELSEGIWRIQAAGGNIGLIQSGNEVVMIDAQYSGLSKRLDSTIQELTNGIQPKYLINTHWHFDHTGGNPFFGEFTTGIGHKNMKKRLAEGQEIKFFNTTFPPAEATSIPEVTFDSIYSLKVGEIKIEIWHPQPSHTDGDGIIFIKDRNIIHMGDCLFSEMYPYIDLESGGNAFGYLNTLKAIYNKIDEDTQLIAGHGPVYHKTQLGEYIQMLEKIAHRVTLHKEESKEAVIKLNLLEDLDARWGNGFVHKDQIVGFFWDSINK